MADPSKINVIIVDDIAETRENIRKLLQFEPNIEVVGVARSGAEAIKVTSETSPDVVLMDINMPDMDGIQATKLISEAVRTAAVVMMSVQSEPGYLRQAMLAAGKNDAGGRPLNCEPSSHARYASLAPRASRRRASGR